MKIDAYLERIGYNGAREPTVETLRDLHRAHLLAVPFENFDIHLGYPIALAIPAFYDKIVRRRRGGFCYELNGLFGWLLEQLGFAVATLSARVFGDNGLGPEYDHLLLLVGRDTQWIADVGFGDSFLEPLRLDIDEAVVQQGSVYRLTGSASEKVLQRRRGADWESQYAFSLQPRRLAEFSAMCRYQQTASTSHFTQKTVCSRATENGRVTLSNNRLIVTAGGQREEREIESEAAYRTLLQTYFGMALGSEERVDRLLVPKRLS